VNPWGGALAVRAARHELPWHKAEDVGQPLDIIQGEPALSAAAMTFGAAHSGITPPAHQLAELGLGPSVALAQDADVRAEDCGLGLGDLAPR
jgi:hypothetical protein